MRADAVRFRSIILPSLFAASMVILIFLFPKQSVQAGLNGVAIWWDILFPSLFPFFVVSELMLGFGIVHFFAALLDPMMRPLFRIPGSGGFVMAMGFASGYPVAARLTSQLWDSRLVNRSESERLIAFTTTGDPIFLIGAVAVGFFHDASLAPVLAISHYGGAVVLGLLLRFRSQGEASEAPDEGAASSPLLRRAFEAMHRARLADGRTFGGLLSDGIESGLKLVIIVGGLVVFFSVVIDLLSMARVIPAMQAAVSRALGLLGLPGPLSAAVINGLFEVTLGAKTAGQAIPGVTLQAQVAVASFGLAWAGLSVHAQIMSIVSHMPVRYAPFALARLSHGLLSGAIAYAAWPWLFRLRGSVAAWVPSGSPSGWGALQAYLPLTLLCFLGVLALIPVIYGIYRAGLFLLRVR